MATASSFDPLTFAVASSLGARLRSSPEVRVTSPDAVAALNDAAASGATIMATLQTDALVELLPVRQLPDGYHASVRLLVGRCLARDAAADRAGPPRSTGSAMRSRAHWPRRSA